MVFCIFVRGCSKRENFIFISVTGMAKLKYTYGNASHENKHGILREKYLNVQRLAPSLKVPFSLSGMIKRKPT